MNEYYRGRFNAIDLWKFLMSICVIAIHTHPLEECKFEIVISIYNTFCTLAVPFFFLTSGYLLSFKLDNSFSRRENIGCVKKYFCRIVKLYLVWTIVYLPMAVWDFLQRGIEWKKATLLWIKRVIFLGQNYNSWHLWTLLSTIYGLLLIILLLKRRNLDLKKMFLYAIIMLVLSGSIKYLVYYERKLPLFLEIIKKILSYFLIDGGFLLGAFYIPLGIILGKKKIDKKISFCLLVFAFILNNFFINSFIKLFLTACCSIGLFSVITQTRLSDSKVYFFLRKASRILYYVHMYVWTFYYMIAYGEKRYGLDSFVVTLMGTILITTVYVVIEQKVKLYGVLKKSLDFILTRVLKI